MLRIGLFVLAASLAGLVNAQVAGDHQAVAPGPFSDVPQNTTCDSGVYNADGSPVVSCNANVPQPAEGDYSDGTGYQEDYSAYAAPVYSDPNFYMGVSLLPYGYWYPGFAFGWPYYWPYYGYGYGYAYWGGYGHYHYGHAGHDDHWDHGHSWDHSGDHGHSGSGSGHSGMPYASTNAGTAHAINGRAENQGSRSPVADSRANSPRAGFAPGDAHAMRTSLPSASYVAAAQRGGTAASSALANRSTAAMAARTTNNGERGSVGSGAVNSRGTNPYRVSSMPNRGYASSGYRNSSSATARSYGSPAQRGYAMSRAPHGMQQQRYSSQQPHGYPAGHGGMPSYSRGGPGVAMHGGGSGSPAHSSGGGGGHAGGYSRGH